MKEYIFIEEAEVNQLLSIPLAISVIERCFSEKAKGTFYSLPKINIVGKNGNLRVTPGESLYEFNAIGFRLYDTIRNDFSKQPQLIVVYDNLTGQLKGIVISQLLGAYRTAATNAVMQKHFHNKTINTLGIVGTGYQAMIHALMFEFLLQPKCIKVYGRTPEKKAFFVKNLSEKVRKTVEIIPCDSIEALKSVDSLLLATRSQDGLLKPEIFKETMIITTIGPKIKGRSELSNAFAESCDLIVTDSVEQVLKYGANFFVENLSSVKDFSSLLKDKNFPINKSKKVLLCSVGMGGTEVALANEIIRAKIN